MDDGEQIRGMRLLRDCIDRYVQSEQEGRGGYSIPERMAAGQQ